VVRVAVWIDAPQVNLVLLAYAGVMAGLIYLGTHFR
jgi:hypothetical protein